ncbi:hypothetical protein AMS68_003172 [Peltaster fructicola]|uniref:DUF1168 domain protein n=1 Tax=Peltaster fructicola TaxID=286661 RepID=A0A6H0XSN5_9PEZI|nr:hypothetical protein AMS68_003172 [Peltaster fructicola]
MSEAIPESIPTSSYKRPNKRPRTTDSTSAQSSQIDALFANPERALEINIGPKAKTLAAPPEIVTNVQGSSAGAGSGEFHVYKASRRREYERLRAMDEDVENEEKDRQWDELREDAKRKDEAKLNKNRARREKQKARQAKGKVQGSTIDEGATLETGQTDSINTTKKKLIPAQTALVREQNVEEQAPANDDTVSESGITFLEED